MKRQHLIRAIIIIYSMMITAQIASPSIAASAEMPPKPKPVKVAVQLVRPLPQVTAKPLPTLQPIPVPAPVAQIYTGTGDPSLDYIVSHESSGNPYAVNAGSGACGLFQALPCAKLGCDLSDIACQIAWGRNYAIQTYGSTYAAMLFWIAHHWW